MRVPICTPSAPSANAAAIERPSQMPPAAMTGTSTREQISGSSTIVATSRGFLKPPPSSPSTTSPSTPASTAFSAARSVGTTWNTVSPAAFSCAVYLVGSPAEVVTKRTPCVDHEVDDRRVAHEQLRDVHAERLVGEVAHLADLVAHRVELAGRGLDDAEAAGVRDRRGELRPGDPAHRRLHDRYLHSQELGHAIADSRHARILADMLARHVGAEARPVVGHGSVLHLGGHRALPAARLLPADDAALPALARRARVPVRCRRGAVRDRRADPGHAQATRPGRRSRCWSRCFPRTSTSR